MTDPHPEFVRECNREVERLDDGLVALESGDGDVEALFRAAHTLKGNCSAAGHEAPARVAHGLEDLLGAVRSGDLAAEPPVMDAAFEAVDELSAMIDAVGRDGRVESDPSTVERRVRSVLEDRTGGATSTGPDDPLADSPAGATGPDDGTAGPTPERTDDSAESSPEEAVPDLEDLAPPEPGEADDDISAEEALERASAFDDLDSLTDRMDDPDDFDVDGVGTFDDFEDADPGSIDEADFEPAAMDDDDGPAGEFAALRDDVEVADPAEMERELEDVEFGEFDDEDDMGIRELVEMDVEPAEDGREPDGATTSEAETADDDDAAAADWFEEGPTPEPESPTGGEGVDPGTAGPGRSGTPSGGATGLDDSAPGADAGVGVSPAGSDPGGSVDDSAVEPVPADEGPTDDRGGGVSSDDEGTDEHGGEAPSDDGGTDGFPSEVFEAIESVSEDGDDGFGDSSPFSDSGDDAVSSADDRPGADTGPDRGTAGPETTAASGKVSDGDDGTDESGAVPDDPEEDVDAREVVEALIQGDTQQSDDVAGGDVAADAPADPDATEAPDAPVAPNATDEPEAVQATPDDGSADLAVDEDEEAFSRDAETAAFAESFGEEFGTARSDDEGPESTATTIAAAVGETGETPREEGGVAGTIPVDVGDVDRLLTLTERLVTTQAGMERAYDGDDRRVEDGLAELREVASELEETVTAARLVSIESAFRGLARTARDAARDADKRVNFETEGESVELDRAIVDALSDPLVHLVRNAVDHGIEPVGERERAGKPPDGTVRVTAERVRDEVVVEVTDDGAGIDREAVRREAVERGVVPESEAAAMDDDAVPDLVFRPGFSTAESVTDVSGRGVGMDVVASTVREYDGEVEIESQPGVGTTVRLRLPVSVALAEVLFVTAGGSTYAVPAEAVERVDEGARATVEDGELVVTGSPDGPRETVEPGDEATAGAGGSGDPAGTGGGSAVAREAESGAVAVDRRPVVDLGRALGADAATRDPPVYVRLRDREFALRVDDVGDWRTVVVTPYEDVLGGVPGIGGATVLGGGDVVNVVDVGSLEAQ